MTFCVSGELEKRRKCQEQLKVFKTMPLCCHSDHKEGVDDSFSCHQEVTMPLGSDDDIKEM